MTYRVKDAVELIRFKTQTVNQLQGKAINQLFSNGDLIRQLQFALDEFARKTKCIEDIFSVTITNQEQFIALPPLILRSKGFRFMVVYLNQLAFPIDIQNLNNVYSTFPLNNYTGIPSWALPWGTTDQQQIMFFPRLSQSANVTTISSNYTPGDMVINVASTAGFLQINGRITVGSHKIRYQKVTATSFIGCQTVEQTEDTAHSSGESVSQNNVWIFYYRLHSTIPINSETRIDDNVAALPLEIPNEYMNGICDETAYQLIKKIDVQRAEAYKVDYETFIKDAEWDINQGRSSIKKTGRIRQARAWESDILENQMY